MANPFTIRIYIPDGDPEGVRVIDKMNWTGRGIVFPRTSIEDALKRPEFTSPCLFPNLPLIRARPFAA